MKISEQNIRNLLKIMDFYPEDGYDNIFIKKYSQHSNYRFLLKIG